MDRDEQPLYGAIEAGGTKWICAVGNGPEDIRAIVRLPTTTPAETLEGALSFFAEQRQRYNLRAVGVGSFGPVDLRPGSATFGYITNTPKPGWTSTDVAGPISRALGLPVAFDTDVNAAVLGEYYWGAAKGCDVAVYITVGTGIGGGAIVRGRPVHGLIHPEMGHMRVTRDAHIDPFPGSCPFHGDCFEGLASGPAITARWGQAGDSLPDDHPAWVLEARYLGEAFANLLCILSPERIIVGGGVMERSHILERARGETAALLAGYLKGAEQHEQLAQIIVPPALGSRAGILGALALAADTVKGSFAERPIESSKR